MTRFFINGLRPTKNKPGTRVSMFSLSESGSSMKEIFKTYADPFGKIDFNLAVKPGSRVRIVIRDFGFKYITFEMDFPNDDFYYTVPFQKDNFVLHSSIEKDWDTLDDWEKWNTMEHYNNALAESQKEERIQKKFSKEFELISFLGEGWSAKVYSCKIRNELFAKNLNLNNEATYAVKIYKMDRIHEKNQEDRIKREFKIGFKLDHPNLVNCLFYGETEDSNPYLLMEYLEGDTLTKYISENHPIETEKILKLITNLCKVVIFLHENDIIHRDIKPDNIMILKNGSIILMDLGVIKDLNESTLSYSLANFLGAIRFSAPEYIFNLDCKSSKMDAYSVGAILFSLVYGHYIFYEENYFVNLLKLKELHSLKFKDIIGNNVLKELAAISEKLLDRNPDKRLGLEEALIRIEELI